MPLHTSGGVLLLQDPVVEFLPVVAAIDAFLAGAVPAVTLIGFCAAAVFARLNRRS